MTDATRNPDPLKGALAGLAAGLAASFVMNQFQVIAQNLLPEDEGSGEPSTEKVADRVTVATTGEHLSDDTKPAAGNLVHYAFGAALGIGYGIAAEYRPQVTAGYGTTFGLGVAAIADEAAVPALGLAPPPTETPLSTHAYGAASHLVFGAVTEAVRRLVRRAV